MMKKKKLVCKHGIWKSGDSFLKWPGGGEISSSEEEEIEVGGRNLGLAQVCVCLTLIKTLDNGAGKMRNSELEWSVSSFATKTTKMMGQWLGWYGGLGTRRQHYFLFEALNTLGIAFSFLSCSHHTVFYHQVISNSSKQHLCVHTSSHYG